MLRTRHENKSYLNFQVPKFPVSRKLFATGAHELYSFASGRSRARFTRKGGGGRGVYIFRAEQVSSMSEFAKLRRGRHSVESSDVIVGVCVGEDEGPAVGPN